MSVQPVVTSAAVEEVVAGTASKLVIAVIAVEEVVGNAANYSVVAAETAEGGGRLVTNAVCVATFSARHVVGFVVNSFKIPGGTVGKDDFFYLVVRSFSVAVVAVAKVLVYGNLVIRTFYRQFKIYAAATISYHLSDNVIWRDSFAKLDSIYAVRVEYPIFPIPLAEDVGIVAFAAFEVIVASAAN